MVNIVSGNDLSHVQYSCAKPLSEPMLTYCQLEVIFIQESVFENGICKMAAILFKP